VARLLYQGGRRDVAFELYSRGASLPPSEAFAEFPIARAYILQSILRINRPDWLAKVLNQGEESAIAGTGRNYLAHVFEVESETIDSLTIGLGVLLKLNDKPLANAVFDFLSGEVPAGFNAQADYQRLFDTLSGQAVVQRPAALDQRFRNRMPQRITLDFAKLFESHGQFDLARQAILENVAMGDIEALLQYAETESKSGRNASAREIFRSVWQRLEAARLRPSRLNRAEEDTGLAMRAILGEAVSAGRMGDGEEAESLWRLIDLMTCTPSAKMRNAFGETLLEQGFDERAEVIYRTLMPWVAFGSDEGVQFQSVARNFSRALGERHEKLAAEVFDLAIAGTIESTFFYPAGYVLFPTLVHRMKVNAAIAAGDQAEIDRQIEALLRLSPMDIDFAENAIKKMRAAGMDQLAEQTIARIYDAGRKYTEQFPLDIVTGNNLAWVMALSDYRLEDALALSKRTVYFSPDSTVYRDTLAEILFRLGRVDEAIAIEQACLLDQSGEWHTHEQLRRFRGEQKTK
jgi:tetratricopeptide (TPR) repeat protein